MKTVLRTLFVWLLLLALPLQGMAAARMLPSVRAPQPATVVQAAPMAKSCHDLHMAAAHADHKPSGDRPDKHGSACADCCIVVALAPAQLVPPACAPPSAAIPFRAGHLASADPSLPERPPRLLVA